ncbi:MAG: class IV adenylate cyclase [Proteobacteria bacterium]|nr:class IV adenylate cyclase [Pseudomonadota bacterium]
MARNIEIKARMSPDQVDSILSKVMSLADQDPIEIHQDDIFFACPNGRLKLRIFSPIEGQLIFYQRPDGTEPKESEYVIAPTSSPDLLRDALTLAYGQVGRVTKTRQLFMVGRTRIHIDEVESLSGHFIELEVVLSEEESAEAGVAVANELLEKLGVSQQQLLAEAYIDLLARELPTRP